MEGHSKADWLDAKTSVSDFRRLAVGKIPAPSNQHRCANGECLHGVRLRKRLQKNDQANPGTGQASNRAGLAMVSSCGTTKLQNEPKALGSHCS